MSYALGKFSYGVCDRCGFRTRYLEMRMEWTGFKVCSECYEPKHPQLEPPRHTTDAEALRQPRPEVPLPQSQLGFVKTTGPRDTTPDGVEIGGPSPITADPIGTEFTSEGATGEVGTVTVVIS